MSSKLIALLKLFFAIIISMIMATAVALADDDDDDDDDDDQSFYEQYQTELGLRSLNRAKVQIRLKPMGFGLMGDSVDGYSGRLQFQTTDISIPGNSNLPVKITRTARGADTAYMQKFYMADWEIDVPRFVKDAEGSSVQQDGETIILPGVGSEELFEDGYDPDAELSTSIFQEPRWGGQSMDKVTVSHTIKRTGGGYVTPDGTEYILGKRIDRSGGDKYLPSDYTPQFSGGRTVTRTLSYWLATEVKDKDGNWVKYEYEGDYLTRIHSNDGREINLSYFSADGTKYVSSITANGRTWTYQYKTVTDIDRAASATRKLLHKVIQPDGKYWEYDIDRLVQDEPSYSNRRGKYASDPTIWVKHPYGAEATYELGEVILDDTDRLSPYNNLIIIGKLWHKSKAVFSKSLLLTGGETLSWSYDYEHRGFESEFTHVRGNGIGTSDCRILTKPDGTRVESIHGRDNGFLRSETYAPGSTNVLKRIEHTYIGTTHNVGRYNGLNMPDEEEYDEGFKDLLSKRIVTQNGDTHTTEYSYDLDPWSPTYSYNKPIETKVYTNVGGSTAPRVTKRDYTHLKNKWILNLLDKSTMNNREVASFDYDTYGRVTKAYRYGQLNMTYGYYGVNGAANSGSLYWQQDALNRRTYAYSWKRGVAQRVRAADNTNNYRYVDNNGWPTLDKDARGAETRYTYDSMGRVTLIDPTGNFWATTAIAYDFSDEGVVQYITKGQSVSTITYDNLFRTVLERSQALDTGWSSYMNTKYDNMGRVKFKSQPSTNPYETKGVDYAYDGLGRIYQERENVAPYARTLHRYYRHDRHRIHDPSGAWTDYYNYSYNGLGKTDHRAIYKYANGAYQQYNYIYKNVHGQMYAMRQWGNANGYSGNQIQWFYYDAQQRLCRHYVPEHGATKYQYDAAGQVIAYAKGQSNSGCGTVPNVSAKVSQSYDLVGRPTLTNFNDPATADISRTYDANGNIKAVNRGGVERTYNYNDINLLTFEALNLDGRGYGTAYAYNNVGHLTRKTQPGSFHIDYSPDGLGRSKTIKNGSTTLASNINYHASGAVSTMSYGNLHSFSQTLNNRLLPERILSRRGGTKAIDNTYSYDARAKVTAISDGAGTGNNRTYGYDGLGRLTSATGPWGAGSYKYDPLDNLRQKKLGSRTVNLTYDTRNRLSQSADTGSSGTRTVGYDAQGNVTTLGNLSFLYDYSDQPVVVSGTANGVGPSNGSYTYDGNLKRVKSMVNGKTIYNVYDASGSLMYVDAVTDNKRTHYIKGPMGTLARVTNNDVTYLHSDRLGSAHTGTNSSGQIRWREKYTPFGEEILGQSANDNLAGFTGHIKDKATGLNYMQARYYDPTIGRFLSVDPMTYRSTGKSSYFNRFRYCSNDPINCSDPTGMADDPETKVDEDDEDEQDTSMDTLEGLEPQKEHIAGGSTSRFGGSVQSNAPTNRTGVYEVKTTSVGKPIGVGKIIPGVGKNIPKAGSGNAVNITVSTFSGSKKRSSKSQDVPLSTGKPVSTFVDVPTGSRTVITVQGMSAAPVHVDIYSVNQYNEKVYESLAPNN